MNDEGKTLKESGFKLDEVKYGRLREDHLKIFTSGQFDQNVSIIHEPTGISVNYDWKSSGQENFDGACQALSQALEHQTSTGPSQPDQPFG